MEKRTENPQGSQSDSPNKPPVRDIAYYREALTPHLPPEIFKSNPWRLGWMFVLNGSAAAFILACLFLDLPWPVKLLFGVLAGLQNGVSAFLAHEISHGSIIRNKTAQRWLTGWAFSPFLISPTFWAYSHNRMHHGKTQQLVRDPDAFPTHRIYKSSSFSQKTFKYTPGSGHWQSVFYFFWFFSFHNLATQARLRFKNGVYDQMDHKAVTREFRLLCFIAALYVIAVASTGLINLLWAVVIPFAFQNYMVMSYIATNHNISPLTKDNDPLLNSLTVRNFRLFEFLVLDFGYHVEHHIFPIVNGKHARTIHKQLLKQFPKEFQVMPKWKAMVKLYQTPRIYKSANEFIHPETLQVVPVPLSPEKPKETPPPTTDTVVPLFQSPVFQG